MSRNEEAEEAVYVVSFNSNSLGGGGGGGILMDSS